MSCMADVLAINFLNGELLCEGFIRQHPIERTQKPEGPEGLEYMKRQLKKRKKYILSLKVGQTKYYRKKL